MYTASQPGAFVSEDKGATWNPLHVMIATTTNCSDNAHCTEKEVDRVPHDYQVRSIAYDLLPNFCTGTDC